MSSEGDQKLSSKVKKHCKSLDLFLWTGLFVFLNISKKFFTECFCPSSCKVFSTASMTLIYNKTLMDIDIDTLIHSQQIIYSVMLRISFLPSLVFFPRAFNPSEILLKSKPSWMLSLSLVLLDRCTGSQLYMLNFSLNTKTYWPKNMLSTTTVLV